MHSNDCEARMLNSLVPSANPTEGKPRATDATGTEIVLMQPAKRIVCLTATGLDILVELGLEPVGYLSEGVAARPEFYGKRAENFVSVGSWIAPNVRAIRRVQPDLVLGWVFPHRFLRAGLRNIAPIYLMSGGGRKAVFARLRDIARLTGGMAEAEVAVARLEARLDAYRAAIPEEHKKTVLLMGGSVLNCLSRNVIVETDAGTFGSVMKELTHYPWPEPVANDDLGFTNVSLKQILQVNPDVIFVQTYRFGPWRAPLSEQLMHNPTWHQLKAVQRGQVHEVDTFWHNGSGTRMIRLMLDHLIPIIYPELFVTPSGQYY